MIHTFVYFPSGKMIPKELEKQIRTAISEVSTRVECQVHTVATCSTVKDEMIPLLVILD